jgi:dTDP-glucose pyrophosphorylase
MFPDHNLVYLTDLRDRGVCVRPNGAETPGLRIAYPVEIAYNQGLIKRDEFIKLGQKFEKSSYEQYLLKVGNEKL